MGIGNRIKEARNNLGYTQEELAELLGITKGAVANYENETSHPKEPIMYKLIESLKVDANYLFQDCVNLPKEVNDVTLAEYENIKKYRFITKHSPEGTATVDTVLNREYAIAEQLKELKERIEELEAENTPKRIIAYYQRLASAGSGDYLFDDIPTEFIQVKDTPISRQADFIIGVNGQSMESTYYDGDKVFVEKLPSIAIGDIGVFTKGNDCYIKELGANRLISHNPDKNTYPDIPANEDIRLVGKVLGKAEI